MGESAASVSGYREIKLLEFCMAENVLILFAHVSSSAGCRILNWKLFFLRIVNTLLYSLYFTSSVIFEKFNAILIFGLELVFLSGRVLEFLFIHKFLKFCEYAFWYKSFVSLCAMHSAGHSVVEELSKFWEIFLYCFFEKRKNLPLLSLYFLPGI